MNKEEALPKRKLNPPSEESRSKIPKTLKTMEELHRTFRNTDLESCWLNSCLQLTLTAMEHLDICQETGSPLWKQLISLLKEGKSPSLDPLPIRDILIRREKQRILEKKIAPVNRLFDLGLAEIFQDSNLLIEANRQKQIGQQDCKDFFICLSENLEHWPDVYGLFAFQSISFTMCS